MLGAECMLSSDSVVGGVEYAGEIGAGRRVHAVIG